ncbi:hypothetical protein CVT25_008125 [Psilocybe cyanescens]|uniref:Hydrophobin n=1 Tax=Psilocybe cyanescens TaxID=93625 RepID=A0A409X9G5_PSICY|nr:hypothetical protein CVT25_008125 [Psilocybe cyanescens]
MAIFTNALAVVAMITIASAAPTSNNIFEGRAANSVPTVENNVPTVEVCTGNVGTGCVTIPVVSDSCVNFTGGLSFLNKESSAVVVPGGFVCTFFADAGCLSLKGGSQVILQGGTWSFANPVPGTGGNVNFNDQASSFSCSPV